MTGLSPVVTWTRTSSWVFLLPIDVEGEFRPPLAPQELFAQVDNVNILFSSSCLDLHNGKHRRDGPLCDGASG